ncbi:TSUP family transporter [Corynebacterium gottingense]|uniref:TSUP family transporter n=1 Tax=Corynebacterium gottingense TaxID=2041036 RepID=UPI0038D02297
MIWLAVGVFVAIAAGAISQRVSGMGLGLIAAPALSLMLGPVVGIILINVLATINAVLNTWSMRADVDWGKFAPIAAALVVGAVPGAFLIRAVSPSALLVVVGIVLLIALSVVTLGKRYVPPIEGALPAAVSGAVGGFMNTLAGVAGPAITVYSQAARWPQRTYAATLQPIFMVSGAVSFMIKELTGAANLATIPAAFWVAAAAGLFVGQVSGTKLAPHIPSAKAHTVALSLAFFGGFTALVRGLVGMFGA